MLMPIACILDDSSVFWVEVGHLEAPDHNPDRFRSRIHWLFSKELGAVGRRKLQKVYYTIK